MKSRGNLEKSPPEWAPMTAAEVTAKLLGIVIATNQTKSAGGKMTPTPACPLAPQRQRDLTHKSLVERFFMALSKRLADAGRKKNDSR